MNKKAVELSMNVIIIAVIALIVLSVVIFIFYDQIKKVATGFEETREKAQICQVGWFGDQKCVSESECTGDWEIVTGKCEEEDKVCCEKKPKTEK